MGARLAVVAALLLAASLSGCAALDELDRLVGRAQGRVAFHDVEVLNQEVSFNATDAPSPPAQGRVTTATFTVPATARDLRVEITVAFDQPGGQPVVPPGVPRGRVSATVLPPGGSATNVTFTETSVQTYTSDEPAPGTWTVRLETLGQGRVRVVAVASEPAP